MDYTPSLYAHVLSGVFLAASILYFTLYISKSIFKDPYQTMVLMLLFSIAVGVHGLSHLGLEAVYRYNPLSLLTEKQT